MNAPDPRHDHLPRKATAMAQRSWAFPNLSRDLAIVGAGIVAAAAFVGAAIGIALDVAIHRHRRA